MDHHSLPEESPFPIGASPFCQKGHVYRTTLKHLDAYLDGRAEQTIRRIEAPGVRDFLAQPFVASAWYDIFPMISLIVETARTAGVPYFRAVSDLSRMLAEADLNGVYRAILRVVSPNILATRLPRIQAQYLNFGRVESTLVAPGHCQVVRAGHPLILVHWFVAVVHGFLPYVLEQAGAKAPRVRWEPPATDGVESGLQTVTLRFEIHWS
jgi:hypothetical protein